MQRVCIRIGDIWPSSVCVLQRSSHYMRTPCAHPLHQMSPIHLCSGDKRYEQYKDNVLGLYSHLDHNDIKRKKIIIEQDIHTIN